MCTDMRPNVSTDMCIDLCIDMCVDTCVGMCKNMCTACACTLMCVAKSMDMCGSWRVYKCVCSPWRAPGAAPVIDSCGSAGGRFAGNVFRQRV